MTNHTPNQAPNQTRIATLSLNPAIDQTARIPGFTAGRVNRVEWEQSDAGGKGVNVASFLANAGLSVVATGLLGTANVEPFVELFARKGIEDRCVRLPG
ncbi:MAG: 1-phosphofructokinase, partial [Gemmatimonadetes bacterium]|nr:1-phosphofructokinase [Gemmatimonadota bacterium]